MRGANLKHPPTSDCLADGLRRTHPIRVQQCLVEFVARAPDVTSTASFPHDSGDQRPKHTSQGGHKTVTKIPILAQDLKSYPRVRSVKAWGRVIPGVTGFPFSRGGWLVSLSFGECAGQGVFYVCALMRVCVFVCWCGSGVAGCCCVCGCVAGGDARGGRRGCVRAAVRAREDRWWPVCCGCVFG